MFDDEHCGGVPEARGLRVAASRKGETRTPGPASTWSARTIRSSMHGPGAPPGTGEMGDICYLARGPGTAGRMPAAPGIPPRRPNAVTDRLEGKVAFITGAGTGIGRSASELFASEGACVVVAEIDAAAGAETEERIRTAGGEALWVETDVTDAGSVRAAFDRAVHRFGRLDVVYNNAGGSTTIDGPVTEAPEEEFWRVIRLDLFGTFLGCKYGIPRLIESGGGSIINTSSNVALMAVRGRDCYTAAKGGVASMTRSMAAEYAQHGVRVNAIAPGATRTPRVAALAEANEHVDRLVREGQLFGWCEPRDIANMALYLASDESRVTTGQILSVDSGATV